MSENKTNKTSKANKSNNTQSVRIRGTGIKKSYGEAIERPTVKPPSFDSKPKD